MTPTGPIKTGPYQQTEWSAITTYDPVIRDAIDDDRLTIDRVRAHIVIESQGNPNAVQQNRKNGNSYGLMQIVPYGVGWAGHHAWIRNVANLPRDAKRAEIIDALFRPAVNIAVGVQLLEERIRQYDDPDMASSAFFLGNPNWQGADTVTGTTGQWYRDTLKALIAEQQGVTPATTTTRPPTTPALSDPISVIMRRPYTAEYGFKHPTDLPYYEYFEGHGGSANQHTGIDVPGDVGEALYTPLPGVVTCAGTGAGTGSWNQGCTHFADARKGAGRVEILLDAGPSLILGHCLESLVNVGQRVTAGQAVATLGTYNGPHVHIETRIWRDGQYWITDPRATLEAAMRGEGAPPVYAERIPIPRPGEFTSSWTVQAIRDGVPVMQHTGPDARPVRAPLAKDETFDAVYLVIGQDGRPWWVSAMGSRIPVDGTSTKDQMLLGNMTLLLDNSDILPEGDCPDRDAIAGRLREIADDLEAL